MLQISDVPKFNLNPKGKRKVCLLFYTGFYTMLGNVPKLVMLQNLQFNHL